MKYKLSSLLFLVTLSALLFHELFTIVEVDANHFVPVIWTSPKNCGVRYRLGFAGDAQNLDYDQLKTTSRAESVDSNIHLTTAFRELDKNDASISVPATYSCSPILRRHLGTELKYNFVFILIKDLDDTSTLYTSSQLASDQAEISVDFVLALSDAIH